MMETTNAREFMEQYTEEMYATMLQVVYKHAYDNGISDDADEVKDMMHQVKAAARDAYATLDNMGYIDDMQAEFDRINAMYEES